MNGIALVIEPDCRKVPPPDLEIVRRILPRQVLSEKRAIPAFFSRHERVANASERWSGNPLNFTGIAGARSPSPLPEGGIKMTPAEHQSC